MAAPQVVLAVMMAPLRMKVLVVLPRVAMLVVNMAALRRVRRKAVPVAHPRVKAFPLAKAVVMLLRPRRKVATVVAQVAANIEKEKAGFFPAFLF